MKEVIEIPVSALMLGMDIVTGKQRGKVQTQRVEIIEHEPRGCRSHVHVNRQYCYDYCATVEIYKEVSYVEFLEMLGIKAEVFARPVHDVVTELV